MTPTQAQLQTKHQERRAGWNAKAVFDRGINLRARRPVGINGYQADLIRAEEAEERRNREKQAAIHAAIRFERLREKHLQKTLEGTAERESLEESEDFLGSTPVHKIPDVAFEVCRQFNVRRIDLISKRRDRSITEPRQIAMAIAKKLSTKSTPEIGRRFGGRDHATVLHACRKYEPLIREVEKKIPDNASIAVWVFAMRKEMLITQPNKPNYYKAKETA